MKLYSQYIFLLCISTSLYAEHFVDQEILPKDQTIDEQIFLNAPLTLESDDVELRDAEHQIPPQALSEEDISTILFNEFDFDPQDFHGEDDLKSVLTNQELKILAQPETALHIAENQAQNLLAEEKTPEALFLQSLENFISKHNILTKTIFDSAKKAKSQGKLVSEHIKDIAEASSISIAQARNMAREYIQKKCQDLNLGITKIEKKSLKTLLKQL